MSASSHEHYVCLIKVKLTRKQISELNRGLRKIDKSMRFVGPVDLPGNNLKGWIYRPDDGTNDYTYQRDLNQQARVLVERILETTNVR
jgi:hypothetical protein